MATQKRKMPAKSKIYKYWKFAGYLGDKNSCMECEENKFPLERAHIIAKCDGGVDAENNLVLVCHRCHALTDGRNFKQWEDKLVGNGIGSLTIYGIRFPGDYLERNKDILMRIINGSP